MLAHWQRLHRRTPTSSGCARRRSVRRTSCATTGSSVPTCSSAAAASRRRSRCASSTSATSRPSGGVSRLPDRGPRITWQSYLRIDHDFGDFTSGADHAAAVRSGATRSTSFPSSPNRSPASTSCTATSRSTASPTIALTLAASAASSIDDGWGTTAPSTARSLRFELPAPLAVGASAGLRVRACSPLGVVGVRARRHVGRGCHEYVEGADARHRRVAADRSQPRDHEHASSSSDYEFCPQREALPADGRRIARDRADCAASPPSSAIAARGRGPSG